MYEYELRTNGTDDDPDSILPNRIWDNFIDELTQVADESGRMFDPTAVRFELAKYNAVSVPGPFIYFLTEEDRTMFVLRWA